MSLLGFACIRLQPQLVLSHSNSPFSTLLPAATITKLDFSTIATKENVCAYVRILESTTNKENCSNICHWLRSSLATSVFIYRFIHPSMYSRTYPPVNLSTDLALLVQARFQRHHRPLNFNYCEFQQQLMSCSHLLFSVLLSPLFAPEETNRDGERYMSFRII